MSRSTTIMAFIYSASIYNFSQVSQRGRVPVPLPTSLIFKPNSTLQPRHGLTISTALESYNTRSIFSPVCLCTTEQHWTVSILSLTPLLPDRDIGEKGRHLYTWWLASEIYPDHDSRLTYVLFISFILCHWIADSTS